MSRRKKAPKSLPAVEYELAPDGRPILLGTITSITWSPDPTDETREFASAVITVKCPHCSEKREKHPYHYHGLPLQDGFGTLTHKNADCFPYDAAAVTKDGYYVGFDPSGKHLFEPGQVLYRPARLKRMAVQS